MVALSGATVSLVENVGSFAEENLPEYGLLFKCLDKGCTYSRLWKVPKTLQNLVTHFHLNRQETEKLLEAIRSFSEKYKYNDLNLMDFSSDLWFRSAHEEERDGRIGFSAKRIEDGFKFNIKKKKKSGINFYACCDWWFEQQAMDSILNTDLDSIKFWPKNSFLRFFKRSDIYLILFMVLLYLLGLFAVVLTFIIYRSENNNEHNGNVANNGNIEDVTDDTSSVGSNNELYNLPSDIEDTIVFPIK